MPVSAAELEAFRSKEHEFAQAMAAALRGATEIEENATARAHEITSKADEAAERARSESHRLIERSRAQLDDLGRLKDEIVASMRKVVRDFDQAISRVERETQAVPIHLSDLADEARPGARPASRACDRLLSGSRARPAGPRRARGGTRASLRAAADDAGRRVAGTVRGCCAGGARAASGRAAAAGAVGAAPGTRSRG